MCCGMNFEGAKREFGCASRHRIMGYIIENKIQDESVEILSSLATLQVCSAL